MIQIFSVSFTSSEVRSDTLMWWRHSVNLINKSDFGRYFERYIYKQIFKILSWLFWHYNPNKKQSYVDLSCLFGGVNVRQLSTV